ncbi:MAG: hypothetical protein EZS28_024575 [Streblomastix strix]|uniref:Uncharacterized protein n=1 Tax=Streblomastix strix TaxID=222440 RepID=A0A5J4VBE2_9EUKA|nr:MAG: hypothetical protein EZS28_024575 [Streblomastix strix]
MKTFEELTGGLGIIGFKNGKKDASATSCRDSYGRQDQIRTLLMHSYSIDLMDDIEQTPTRRAHHKKFKASQGKDSEETIKTMQEQIDEDL